MQVQALAGLDAYLVVQTVSPGERARLEPFDAVELDVSRLFGDIGGPPSLVKRRC